MAIKKIFKSTHPSINFVTKLGATLAFQNGRYVTGNAREIAELEQEVLEGHPHIYVDASEKEIDTEVVDAIAAAEAEARKKVLAEHAAKTGVVADASGIVQSTISPAALISATQTVRNAVGTVGVAGSSAVATGAASVSK